MRRLSPGCLLVCLAFGFPPQSRAADPGLSPVAVFELSEEQLGSASGFLSFSPDGQYLACGWALVRVPSCQAWGSFDAKPPERGTAKRLTFSADSKSVVLNSGEPTLWELPTADAAAKVVPPLTPAELEGNASKLGDKVRLPSLLAECYAVVRLADGKQLATTSENMVAVRDASTGKILSEADAGVKKGIPLPCLGGTQLLVWKHREQSAPLVLWDMKRVRAEKLPGSDNRPGYSVAVSLSPDGATLAEAVLGGQDSGELRVWDLKAKTFKATKTPAAPASVAFFATGDALAVGFAGGAVEVWDLKTGQRTTVERTKGVTAERFNVEGVAVSADGNHLAAYSRFEQLALYSKTLKAVTTENSSPYFPTAAGSTWVYRREGGKRLAKVISAGCVVVGNERLVRFDTLVSLDQQTPVTLWERVSDTEYFAVTKSGVELRSAKWYDANSSGGASYTPALTLFPLPGEDGAKWEVKSKATAKDPDFSHTATATFRLRTDAVQVPAGKFDALLAETARFLQDSKAGEKTEAREYWFAKDVGRVKWAEGDRTLRELVAFIPPPKGDVVPPSGLSKGSVWVGRVSGIPATLYVVDAGRGQVSGELWLDTGSGIGKLAFTGATDGKTATLDTTVKAGAGLAPATNAGKLDGNTFSGTWRGKRGGEGSFSFQLIQR